MTVHSLAPSYLMNRRVIPRKTGGEKVRAAIPRVLSPEDTQRFCVCASFESDSSKSQRSRPRVTKKRAPHVDVCQIAMIFVSGVDALQVCDVKR